MRPGYRQLMEIILFENPKFDGNTLFKKCLELDYGLENYNHLLHTSLIMDCRQHATFNYDDARDFALNFTAPLLIECGCPSSLDDYTAFSEHREGALQKADKEYIYMYQIEFSHKSLAGICLDVLRRHFKGSQIHRFVKYSNIPSKITLFCSRIF